MWLSVPMRDSKSYVDSCPQEGTANTRAAAPAMNGDHFCFLVRICSPLEVKVKTQQQFAGVDVCRRQSESWPRPVLMHPVVFVVPGESGTAGHERVIAVANRVGSDVAEVRRNAGRGLLRHSDRLIPPDEDELRAVHVMGLDENAIPTGRSRSSRQSRTRKVVVGSAPTDQIPVTLAKPLVVPPVLG